MPVTNPTLSGLLGAPAPDVRSLAGQYGQAAKVAPGVAGQVAAGPMGPVPTAATMPMMGAQPIPQLGGVQAPLPENVAQQQMAMQQMDPETMQLMQFIMTTNLGELQREIATLPPELQQQILMIAAQLNPGIAAELQGASPMVQMPQIAQAGAPEDLINMPPPPGAGLPTPEMPFEMPTGGVPMQPPVTMPV